MPWGERFFLFAVFRGLVAEIKEPQGGRVIFLIPLRIRGCAELRCPGGGALCAVSVLLENELLDMVRSCRPLKRIFLQGFSDHQALLNLSEYYSWQKKALKEVAQAS